MRRLGDRGAGPVYAATPSAPTQRRRHRRVRASERRAHADHQVRDVEHADRRVQPRDSRNGTTMTEQLAVRRPVGQILAMELDARDWTQLDFAAVLKRPVQFVSEIVNGKKEITRESAAQIAAAFGHSAEFWLNLQNAYLLSEQAKNIETARELNEVRRRARLNQLAPIAALRKRGILAGRTLQQLEQEIMNLYDLQSIEDDPSFVVAARRSNDDIPLTPTQTAWVGCVRKAAKSR